MFLKRFSVLSLGVIVFVASYILFFRYHYSKIETDFQQTRQDYHVDGVSLVTPPSGDVAANAGAASAAPISPAPVAAPRASDTKPIIGPLPPSTQIVPTRFLFGGWTALLLTQMNSGAPMNSPVPPSQASVPASATSSSVSLSASPAELPPQTMATSPTPAGQAAAPSLGMPPRPPQETSVIILGYHQFMGPTDVSKNPYKMRVSNFEGEMRYLRDNGYHVIPLSDVVKYVKHEIDLQPNSVAITIDDGYKSSIVYAAPVLKQYGYPWTFFVYPDFITVAESKGAASWSDLLELQKDGVEIECHSMTHPQLTKHRQKWQGTFHGLTPEEYDAFLTNETATAKAVLEQHLGQPVEYLAYPYGEYNAQVQAKAVAAGFDAIFTVADNPVHRTTDRFSMGRYIITQPVERNFASYLREAALSVADAEPAPGAVVTEPRPMIRAVLSYKGTLDPKSIEASIRNFGIVHSDYDPGTSTVRIYLPHDLVDPNVIVRIHARDAQSGQLMVADWRFNYELAGHPTKVAPPIGLPAIAPGGATMAEPAAPVEGTGPISLPTTNAPSVTAVPVH